MNTLIKSYIDFKKDIIGLDNPKTFVETYRWARKNGYIWNDIVDFDDKLVIKFSLKYKDTIFIIECDYTDNSVGEVLIIACYKHYDPSVVFGCDTTAIHRFKNEVDWWCNLGIAYALNNHSKCFENCSGITKLVYIPCDEVGNETDDKNADYICYDTDHDKIGYVFVLDEIK